MIISQNGPIRQKGSAIMTALFVLVVIGFLGGVMVRLLQSGEESLAREVLSARALLAAESGAQKMLSDIAQAEIIPVPPALDKAATCANGTSLAANTSGLNACSVVTACTTFSTPANGDFFYSVVSTGTCGTAPEQTVRVVQVKAKNL